MRSIAKSIVSLVTYLFISGTTMPSLAFAEPVIAEETTATKIGLWFTADSLYSGSQLLFTKPGVGDRKLVTTFRDLEPGEYSVAVSYWPHKRRASNAPFSVYSGDYATGTGTKIGPTIIVNQRRMQPDFTDQTGRPFMRLESPGNTFIIESQFGGSGVISLVLSNDADDIVMLDAVRIERVGDGQTLSENTRPVSESGFSVILDDASLGFTTSGIWRTGATASSLNGAFLYRFGEGSTSSFAAWQVGGLTRGSYNVYALTPPSQYAATSAEYEISDVSSGNDVRGVFYTNQKSTGTSLKEGRLWTKVTTIPVVVDPNSGTLGTLRIRLKDSLKQYIFADAVLVERAGESILASDLRPAPITPGMTRLVTMKDYRGELGTQPTFQSSFDGERIYAVPGGTSKSFTWDFIGAGSGEYKVEVSFPSFQTSSETARYQVLSGNTVLGEVIVNQRSAPAGGFFTLNSDCQTFVSSGSDLRVRLLGASDGWVYAGDARVTKLSPSTSIVEKWRLTVGESITMDSDNRCAKEVGAWRSQKMAGSLGGETRLNYPNGSLASWQMAYLIPARYEISVSFPPSSVHNNAAVYSVFDGQEKIGEVTKSQRISGVNEAGVRWTSLGSFEVSSDRLRVELSTGGLLSAFDGVKIRLENVMPEVSLALERLSEASLSVGETIYCRVSTLDTPVTLTYDVQLLEASAAVTVIDEKTISYIVKPADFGGGLQCQAKVSNGQVEVTKKSEIVAVGNRIPIIASVSITDLNSGQQTLSGDTLRCAAVASDPDGPSVALTYRWSGIFGEPVPGAGISTYLVRAADVGSQIGCTAIASDSFSPVAAEKNSSTLLVSRRVITDLNTTNQSSLNNSTTTAKTNSSNDPTSTAKVDSIAQSIIEISGRQTQPLQEELVSKMTTILNHVTANTTTSNSEERQRELTAIDNMIKTVDKTNDPETQKKVLDDILNYVTKTKGFTPENDSKDPKKELDDAGTKVTDKKTIESVSTASNIIDQINTSGDNQSSGDSSTSSGNDEARWEPAPESSPTGNGHSSCEQRKCWDECVGAGKYKKCVEVCRPTNCALAASVNNAVSGSKNAATDFGGESSEEYKAWSSSVATTYAAGLAQVQVWGTSTNSKVRDQAAKAAVSLSTAVAKASSGGSPAAKTKWTAAVSSVQSKMAASDQFLQEEAPWLISVPYDIMRNDINADNAAVVASFINKQIDKVVACAATATGGDYDSNSCDPDPAAITKALVKARDDTQAEVNRFIGYAEPRLEKLGDKSALAYQSVLEVMDKAIDDADEKRMWEQFNANLAELDSRRVQGGEDFLSSLADLEERLRDPDLQAAVKEKLIAYREAMVNGTVDVMEKAVAGYNFYSERMPNTWWAVAILEVGSEQNKALYKKWGEMASEVGVLLDAYTLPAREAIGQWFADAELEVGGALLSVRDDFVAGMVYYSEMAKDQGPEWKEKARKSLAKVSKGPGPKEKKQFGAVAKQADAVWRCIESGSSCEDYQASLNELMNAYDATEDFVHNEREKLLDVYDDVATFVSANGISVSTQKMVANSTKSWLEDRRAAGQSALDQSVSNYHEYISYVRDGGLEGDVLNGIEMMSRAHKSASDRLVPESNREAIMTHWKSVAGSESEKTREFAGEMVSTIKERISCDEEKEGSCTPLEVSFLQGAGYYTQRVGDWTNHVGNTPEARDILEKTKAGLSEAGAKISDNFKHSSAVTTEFFGCVGDLNTDRHDLFNICFNGMESSANLSTEGEKLERMEAARSYSLFLSDVNVALPVVSTSCPTTAGIAETSSFNLGYSYTGGLGLGVDIYYKSGFPVVPTSTSATTMSWSASYGWVTSPTTTATYNIVIGYKYTGTSTELGTKTCSSVKINNVAKPPTVTMSGGTWYYPNINCSSAYTCFVDPLEYYFRSSSTCYRYWTNSEAGYYQTYAVSFTPGTQPTVTDFSVQSTTCKGNGNTYAASKTFTGLRPYGQSPPQAWVGVALFKNDNGYSSSGQCTGWHRSQYTTTCTANYRACTAEGCTPFSVSFSTPLY